jgi:aspartyl-tRNA(Asn)/glutamyl-tRNA(Gln) amidotransferase subunit A
MTTWLDRPIPEIASAVSRGDVSAEEIARESIASIEKENPRLGAFLAISAEQALSQAREVDKRRAAGERLGKLAGVPIGLKDALCTRGTATTCASKILTRGASAVRRDGGDPAEGARRRLTGQMQHGRVRDGFVHRKQRLLSNEEPLGSHAHTRRFVGR